MSYLKDLIAEIEKTHKNYGKFVATLHVAVKARKMVMVVSPSGCGKSKAMELITENTPNSMSPDRISLFGLSRIADKLCSFRSLITIDDITTTGGDYARKTTITTLAALAYSHRVESMMQGMEYAIEDFHGSVLIGIQPIMLRNLMLLDEWVGSIQDKTLRYYHMFRPLYPADKPNLKLQQGIDIDLVNDFEPDILDSNWNSLLELGASQWSRARIKEHMRDLLKAIAAIEKRKDVIPEDYELLIELLKPMAIENLTIVKEELDGESYLDSTLINLLVEYYSYGGSFPLAQVATDYRVKLNMAYKILASQNGNWQQIAKSPTIYKPSEKLLNELKQYKMDIDDMRLL